MAVEGEEAYLHTFRRRGLKSLKVVRNSEREDVEFQSCE